LLAGSMATNAKEVPVFYMPPIPDWATWKCENPEITHQIIESYGCYGPEEKQISRVLIKLKGAKQPFLIGWGYGEQDLDPVKKAYAALYKDGRWIVGARGRLVKPEQRRSGRFHKLCAQKRRARTYPQQHKSAALVYRRRHRKLGLCLQCPRKAFKGGLCRKHYTMKKERYYYRAVG